MKWTFLAVSLVALIHWSYCRPESRETTSSGFGYELIQARLDGMEEKMIELNDKFDALLNQQIATNKHLKQLTTTLEGINSGQSSPSKFAIPTGCVKIRSFFANKYLAVSSGYDSQRNHVTVQGTAEPWTLVRQGDIYRITRRQGGEDLYAAMGDLAYDSQRRRIFTWIPGFGEDQGKWEIERAADFPGMVHIRSWYFGEYLYAADFQDLVFTWIPKGEPGRDSQYLWQIEQC